MKPEQPLVSVVICVYNAGRYLRPSVLSVLEQTHRNLEVLIVDDGSTDECMAQIDDLNDPRVRVFHQSNKGKPWAMNLALEHARGEFYAVHDADDLSHPRRIEEQVACLQQNPDVAAVFCGNDLILGESRTAPIASAKDRAACRDDIEHFRMPGLDPTAMYRSALVSGMKYEPSLPVVEGLDYVLRVGERHPMLVLGKCLYSYRVHLASVTKSDPARRERLVAEALRRAAIRRGVPSESIARRAAPSASSRKDNNLAAHFMDSVCDLRRKGRRRAAIATALRCSRLRLTDSHYHKALVYALAPMALVNLIRGARTSPAQ